MTKAHEEHRQQLRHVRAHGTLMLPGVGPSPFFVMQAQSGSAGLGDWERELLRLRGASAAALDVMLWEVRLDVLCA